MLTTGTKGPIDENDNRLIPAYWRSEEELYRKYVDDKYAGNLNAIAATRDGPSSAEDVAAFRRFLTTLPSYLYACGFRQPPSGVDSRLNALYQAWLRERFGSIEALNAAYIEEDTSFETVLPPNEAYARPHWQPALGPKWDDWQLFKATLPIEFRLPVTTRALYQDFMRAEYRFSFDSMPRELRGSAAGFDELEVPASGPGLAAFEARGLPGRYRLQSVEERWLEFTGRANAPRVSKPGTPSPLRGTSPTRGRSPGDLPLAGQVTESHRELDPIVGGAGVRLPIEAYERTTVHETAGALRREFATRNYAYVLRYLTINGHALWTTIIYCGLAIVTTLGVNGLAAYALSRYPIRASGKILVFLLATMAFPAEVTMIPNFLLLKNLHLLNTFAALVLPGAASGFMIFMLKGFFDSLPIELFEAASLDGAPEITMLRRIAIPLSRPVFGYFALVTFMGAYGTFLYAFLVAQDRRMWTVMVFLYQLSGSAPKYVMMAAFTLAALPTLIVFLLAQRTIMRGIVLPSER